MSREQPQEAAASANLLLLHKPSTPWHLLGGFKTQTMSSAHTADKQRSSAQEATKRGEPPPLFCLTGCEREPLIRSRRFTTPCSLLLWGLENIQRSLRFDARLSGSSRGRSLMAADRDISRKSQRSWPQQTTTMPSTRLQTCLVMFSLFLSRPPHPFLSQCLEAAETRISLAVFSIVFLYGFFPFFQAKHTIDLTSIQTYKSTRTCTRALRLAILLPIHNFKGFIRRNIRISFDFHFLFVVFVFHKICCGSKWPKPEISGSMQPILNICILQCLWVFCILIMKCGCCNATLPKNFHVL